jgi:hypothetical protein
MVYVKLDTNLYDVKVSETNDSGDYYISAFYKSKNIITVGYYFNKKDDICYLKRCVCTNSILNETIRLFNEDYVKISELEWKDYKTNSIYSIHTTTDGVFYFDIELDKIESK